MSDLMEKNVTGLDELLAGYAAGTLAAPAHVLVGAHLELRDTHRSFVSNLEAMAGLGMDDAEPVAVSDRDLFLASIFDSAPEQPKRSGATDVAAKRSDGDDGWMPLALRPLLPEGAGAGDGLAWKSLLPGVKECRLGEIDGCATSLLWVRAGKAMPSHTHSGTELTLVLQGGFSDEDGHFQKGDIAFADHEVDHKPIADDEGEDCICFTVTEGSLRLTGPIGRLFAPFMR